MNILTEAEIVTRANEVVGPYGLRAEVMPDINSVGVQGDGRVYLPVLNLIGPMQTDDPRLPVLSSVLTNTLPISRVTLEIAMADPMV